jgi:hypothetical protein
MGRWAGLEGVRKVSLTPGFNPRTFPHRSESLYRPRFPSTQDVGETKEYIRKSGRKEVQ